MKSHSKIVPFIKVTPCVWLSQKCPIEISHNLGMTNEIRLLINF